MAIVFNNLSGEGKIYKHCLTITVGWIFTHTLQLILFNRSSEEITKSTLKQSLVDYYGLEEINNIALSSNYNNNYEANGDNIKYYWCFSLRVKGNPMVIYFVIKNNVTTSTVTYENGGLSIETLTDTVTEL